MLAVWKLQDNAYAVSIQELLAEDTGETWSFGSIYVTLDRLTGHGLVQSELSEPTSERGGRSKRMYMLTSSGRSALVHIRSLQNELWAGVSMAALMAGGQT